MESHVMLPTPALSTSQKNVSSEGYQAVMATNVHENGTAGYAMRSAWEYAATGRINSLKDMWRGLIHVTSTVNIMNFLPFLHDLWQLCCTRKFLMKE
jgi:hypothetical protein